MQPACSPAVINHIHKFNRKTFGTTLSRTSDNMFMVKCKSVMILHAENEVGSVKGGGGGGVLKSVPLN